MKHVLLIIFLTAACSCRGSLEGPANGTDGGADGGPNNTTDDVRTPNDMSSGNNTTPNNVARDIGTSSDVSGGTDAGACPSGGLASLFSTLPVAGSGSQDLHAVAAGAGAVLGWKAADGIHVAHVDAGASVLGNSTIDGANLFGLAAHEGGRAAMVSRGSDVLALVILDATGGVVSDQTIIGDVPHGVTNNEWFGPLIRQGTMTWTGTQWATYFSVQRLWNDGIEHYGDQLRLYAADGSSNAMVWGWGCSHSMEVKISHNGERLGPVCSSDCFPSKGVHFNHNGGRLWPDEGGSNCAGQYGTALGASVPIPGGFWVAFAATDDRQSYDVAITRIDGTTAGTPIWLTEDATDHRVVRAATYGDDLLVSWTDGAAAQFAVVSGSDGSPIAGPTPVPGAELDGSSDFFVYANGDVGWAQSTGGQAELARLRVCP